jgi:hypothetical protein
LCSDYIPAQRRKLDIVPQTGSVTWPALPKKTEALAAAP